MIKWNEYSNGDRWCKQHYLKECPQCVRAEEAEREDEKAMIMKRVKNFEVKAADVHKLVRFLEGGFHHINTVKLCPKCFMPNLIGSGSNTDTVICDTCDALWMNPDKELMSLDVETYLMVIKSLPLVNRGKILLLPSDRMKYRDQAPITYEDLSEEDLHKYDELMGTN